VLAAARLLEESDLPAAEVAARCGFADASRFSSHFRRRIGASPAAYRRSRAAVA